jgi:hypothetical protein
MSSLDTGQLPIEWGVSTLHWTTAYTVRCVHITLDNYLYSEVCPYYTGQLPIQWRVSILHWTTAYTVRCVQIALDNCLYSEVCPYYTRQLPIQWGVSILHWTTVYTVRCVHITLYWSNLARNIVNSGGQTSTKKMVVISQILYKLSALLTAVLS